MWISKGCLWASDPDAITRHLDSVRRATTQNEGPDYKAEHGDENAGKEGGPEAADCEPPDQFWDQQDHQGIDNQKEQAERQ